MDRFQAINAFWNSFGVPAYPETSPPDSRDENGRLNALEYPYITYSVAVADIGDTVPLTADLWYYSTSWREASRKADEIRAAIGDFTTIRFDGGVLLIVRGSPFAQQMHDDNDSVKRMYINILAEFLSHT
jgi:hypothetical protein